MAHPRSPTSVLFAHLETMRPYTLLWCGMVSLAGLLLATGHPPSLRDDALVFLAPVLGWIAGLYLADYIDRDLDRIQKPHRPIPSGRMKPAEALTAGAVYAFTGLALTVFLGPTNVVFALLAAFLVFVYARYTKPRGLLGNATRGVLTLVTFLFGVAAAVPLTAVPVALWVCGAVFFLHDTNSNIIGALRDTSGDASFGYRTTPVRYGMGTALAISIALSLSYLVLAIVLIQTSSLVNYPLVFYATLAFCILLLVLMYGQLSRSVHDLSPAKALVAHELFVAERIVFASAFLLGVVGVVPAAVAFVVVALLLTVVSQFLLRKRYELT